MANTNKVTLRPFKHDDIETYRGWVNDPMIGRLIGRDTPVTKAEHRRWHFKLSHDENARVFAIEVNSKYIGNVWLYDIDKGNRKAEVRILIGAEQGSGYGTEAIYQITQYAFETHHLNRVYAYVFEYNKRAKEAFEAAGFVVEGLLKSDRFLNGKYVDTYIMAKVKE
jgi:RimJ/RimL family protein N-acetyltransferase